jgi:two-component system, OmpR family, sensor histidine kinase CpxA
MLSRALANVIRNAIRYAGNAGTITISASEIDDQVRIIVADRGAGVPESDLEKLFDPFYRIETDRSRATGGTGLGLAIVKTCVEACGGHVFAENLAPAGFAVTIVLKRADAN